jgi:hypothetical protein
MIACQSIGNSHDGVGLGIFCVLVGKVADGVRVGSPGIGVLNMAVVEFVEVGDPIEDTDWGILGLPSAKEIARPPPIMVIEMRAARNPEISSRLLFMGKVPPQKRTPCYSLPYSKEVLRN